MAVDITKHYEGHMNQCLVAYGTGAFSGVGLTVQVPCSFNKPVGCWITPKAATNTTERYYCDLTNDGGTTTITRVCANRVASVAIDEDQIYSLAATASSLPIGIAQRNYVIRGAEFYQATGWRNQTPSLTLTTAAGTTLFSKALTTTDGATTTVGSSDISTAAGADGDVWLLGISAVSGWSVTSTGTATATQTSTSTGTQTDTSTGTATATSTQTLTASTTGTDTASETASASISESVSASVTKSVSASVSTSGTTSVSASSTYSASEEAEQPTDCCFTLTYWTPESSLEFSYVLFGLY
jgi:hypothetical protein